MSPNQWDPVRSDCGIARQAPLSMGFSRQEYWSGLAFPSPGIFLTQGSSPHLLHWGGFFTNWTIRGIVQLNLQLSFFGLFSLDFYQLVNFCCWKLFILGIFLNRKLLALLLFTTIPLWVKQFHSFIVSLTFPFCSSSNHLSTHPNSNHLFGVMCQELS